MSHGHGNGPCLGFVPFELLFCIYIHHTTSPDSPSLTLSPPRALTPPDSCSHHVQSLSLYHSQKIQTCLLLTVGSTLVQCCCGRILDARRDACRSGHLSPVRLRLVLLPPGSQRSQSPRDVEPR